MLKADAAKDFDSKKATTKKVFKNFISIIKLFKEKSRPNCINNTRDTRREKRLALNWGLAEAEA